MRIKRFNQFEAISGWELVGTGFGPGSPRQELPTSLSTSDTQTLLGKDEEFYSYDKYQDKFQEYRKLGGLENFQEFTKTNLDTMIDFCQSKSKKSDKFR